MDLLLVDLQLIKKGVLFQNGKTAPQRFYLSKIVFTLYQIYSIFL